MKEHNEHLNKKICLDCGGIKGEVFEEKLFVKCETCGSQYPTPYCYDKRWRLSRENKLEQEIERQDNFIKSI